METLILQSLLFVFVTARLAISKDVYTQQEDGLWLKGHVALDRFVKSVFNEINMVERCFQREI